MPSKKISALNLLIGQHFEVHGLLDKVLRNKSKNSEPLLHLAQVLTLNMTLKQRLLYPVVAAEALDWPFDDVRQEQLQLRRTLSHVLCLEVNEPLFQAAVRGLKALLEQQYREEEESLFPQIRATLNAARLAEMAAAMKALARQLAGVGDAKAKLPPAQTTGLAMFRVVSVGHEGEGPASQAPPAKHRTGHPGGRRDGSSPLR